MDESVNEVGYGVFDHSLLWFHTDLQLLKDSEWFSHSTYMCYASLDPVFLYIGTWNLVQEFRLDKALRVFLKNVSTQAYPD